MDIIVLRLDQIGDFLLGIPAYRALRKAYPRDRITVIVSPPVKDLAESCPYFDEVYLFEAQWLTPGRRFLRRWKSALKLTAFLRARRAEMVIDFRNQSRLDTFVTGCSGAKIRAGFDLGFPASVFLNSKCPQPPSDLHQVERPLFLLKALGVEADGRDLEVWLNAWDRKTALDHLPRQGALPGLPRIAVHIGAATPTKQWAAENFSVLIQELARLTQAEVLLLGGVDDLNQAKEVTEGLKTPIINQVGKLNLRQTAALLTTCQVFVGGDSGPAHLAAACGIPVVSLFSAANRPEVWRPWGEKVKVLTVKPECSPCQSYVCRRTDGYFCMNEIGVDQVVEAVRQFLPRA